MKKAIPIVLIFIMILLQCVTVSAKTEGEKLKELGLISGDEYGNLNEVNRLTRAELATIICKMNNVEAIAAKYTTDMEFKDVNTTAWYHGYVNYARSRGWLKGVSNDLFDPQGYVTEEMVATVTLRLLEYDPSWGSATYLSSGIGIDVNVANSRQISRGDVFRYIYKSLFVNIKNSNKTLRDSLGLDIPLSSVVIGFKDINSNKTSLVDLQLKSVFIKGMTTMTETVDVTTGVINYYIEQSSIIKGPFTKKWNKNAVAFASLSDAYYNDSHYLIIDKSNNQIHEGVIPQVEGYFVSGFTNSDIILSTFDNNNVPKFRLYNNDEILIIGQNGYEPISIDVIQEGYLKVEYDNGTGYIYDLERDISVIKYEYPIIGKLISSSEYLYWFADGKENVIHNINLLTKESKTYDVPEKNVGLSIIWDYNTSYGIIRYMDSLSGEIKDELGSRIINQDLKLVLKTDLLYEKFIPVSYENFIIGENSKKGLANIKGTILIPVNYEYINYYDINKIETVLFNGEKQIYDSNYKKVTQITVDKLISILPSGYKIIVNNQRLNYIDTKGNIIISGDNIDYIANLDLLIVSESNKDYLFDSKGNNKIIGMTYDVLYNSVNSYIGVIRNGETYLLDGEGNIVYGPMDGEIYYINIR